MSKRRLSQRQQIRIVERQQRELSGKSTDSTTTLHAANCNGRIISHFGQQLDVEVIAPDATAPSRIVRCYQRANLPPLVTGDRVVWEAGEDGEGVIVAVAERDSVFGRPAFGGSFKPMAANISRVLVVIAPVPEPFPNLIDRYLVAIETLGLEAVLVLNKCDLGDDLNRLDLDNILSTYAAIGYPVYRLSTLDGTGIATLESALHQQTAVLVGQSGVGKSSLINRLGAAQMAVVGALSDAKAKGTHTTTTARLFHLGNCDLIDSPGIREFSLGYVNPEQLFQGFREFRQFAGSCKFRDCQHATEPGCALQEAASTGQISGQRLKSYFQIRQSIGNGTD